MSPAARYRALRRSARRRRGPRRGEGARQAGFAKGRSAVTPLRLELIVLGPARGLPLVRRPRRPGRAMRCCWCAAPQAARPRWPPPLAMWAWWPPLAPSTRPSAPARPGARAAAFALMPVIPTTLFEFSPRETAAMSAVRTGAWPAEMAAPGPAHAQLAAGQTL